MKWFASEMMPATCACKYLEVEGKWSVSMTSSFTDIDLSCHETCSRCHAHFREKSVPWHPNEPEPDRIKHRKLTRKRHLLIRLTSTKPVAAVAWACLAFQFTVPKNGDSIADCWALPFLNL